LGFNLGYGRGEVAFGWTSLARCRLSDRFAAFMSNDAKAEARTHTRAKGADRCNAMQCGRNKLTGASPVPAQMWQR
jgi:hypothetical protein